MVAKEKNRGERTGVNYFLTTIKMKLTTVRSYNQCKICRGHLHSVYIHTYICINVWGAYDKFPDFFVWALLLIVHTWPLRSNLLLLQCTCCTISTTSRRSHGSPLLWVCQWPSSQPLSTPQLSHNDSLWA